MNLAVGEPHSCGSRIAARRGLVSRASMAHIRQSRPGSSLGFQIKVVFSGQSRFFLVKVLSFQVTVLKGR